MTLEELLASAAERGPSVSADQFRRWRGLGLMHAPAKNFPGRGKGVVATYDQSHLIQAVAVAEALSEDPRTERVMWKLWMQGYAIDGLRIKAQLKHTLQQLEKARSQMRRTTTHDSASVRFENATTERLFDHGLANIRRRILKKNFTWLVHVIMQVVTGVYESSSLEDEALVLFSLGLVPTLEPTPIAGVAPSGFLHQMSAQFTKDRLDRGMRGLGPDELIQARDTLRKLQPALRAVMATAAAHVKLVGAETAEPLLELPPRFLFLVWLGVRKHPKFEPFYNMLLTLPQLLQGTRTPSAVPHKLKTRA